MHEPATMSQVQLERISAACLGVQAYDDRFNDMQKLIVGLEQRCANTTRLTALAQQCTVPFLMLGLNVVENSLIRKHFEKKRGRNCKE